MNLDDFSPIFISVVNALLMALLPALAVALVSAITVWARKAWAEFKRNEPTIADQVAFYVRIAVEAAEQAGVAKLIEDKKQYALDIALRWLEQNGLNGIDIELIAAEIERQVYQMNKSG